MNLFREQINIDKLLQNLENLKLSDRRLYKKSKDRLKTLLVTCYDVVDMLEDILHDELLEDQYEFEELDSTGVVGVMQEFEDSVQSMKSNIQGIESQYSTVTKQQKKIAFRKYIEVISNFSSGYSKVDECANMLAYWFERRFLNSSDRFYYNLANLPKWIYCIVLGYGKSVRENNNIQFIDSFREWADSISENSVNYPLPYNIFRLTDSSDPSNYTLESVVIWDILVRNGYHNLCDKTPPELYFNQTWLYDRCGECNPSELDNYKYFEEDDSVFQYCNLDRMEDK